jgi:hypothetical protein
MDPVLVSSGGDFAPSERLYAYWRICFKTNTKRDELNDQGLVMIKALQIQLSSIYVGQSLDALRDKVNGYHRCFERNDGLYARIMLIIQSPGTNKLADSVLEIAFTLGQNGNNSPV